MNRTDKLIALALGCLLAALALVMLTGCASISPTAILEYAKPHIEEAAGEPLPEIDWDQIGDKAYVANLKDRLSAWWELTPWANVEEPSGSVAVIGPALPITQPPEGASLEVLWKPEADTRPGAALLFHKSLGEVSDVTINGEAIKYENRGFTNGDRWTIFPEKKGASYGNNVLVQATINTGHRAEWIIPRGDKRTDPAKGKWIVPDAPDVTLAELFATDKQGFFSVAIHDEATHAGEYSQRGRVRDGSAYDLNPGESVYRMLSVGGSLWAVTENKGILFRDRKEIVRACKWGFGLVEHNGYIYSTHSNPRTRIFRTRISDNAVEECRVDNQTHCTARSIAVLDGVLYAPGFDYGKEAGGWFKSTDGITFEWSEQISNVRFLDSCVYNDRLWLAASPYRGGQRVHPAGVYSTTGSGVREELRTTSTRVGMCIAPYRGGLAFGTLVNWRATSGNGELWTMDEAGQWGLLWQAPEPELTRLVEHDGVLYAVTRKENGHGKVYAIK